MSHWKFAKAIRENEEFRIEGLNIWNHYWHCVDKKVEVAGPDGGNIYYFKEYQIADSEKTVNFVAGEFSYAKVGVYIKDELREGKL